MSCQVLVVEKDKQVGNLAASILESRGIQLTLAESAHHALSRLDILAAQLIIVEEQLSDIDGLGFIAKLRERHDKVPVLYVARKWRDDSFYRMMREDLKVSLVVHRPLRAAVFSAQLLGLLGVGAGESVVGDSADLSVSMPVPQAALEPSATVTAASGAEFDKIKARFLRSLPERLAKLESGLKRLSNRSASAEEAIIVAHNLKGTSLSWGFEDLGTASGLMEKGLKQYTGADSDEQRTAILNDCSGIFECMIRNADKLKSEAARLSGDSSDAANDEHDLSAAKVLVVSDDPPPSSKGITESGLALDFIHARTNEAIDKASQFLLDAALIEIGPKGGSLGIARQLRDITGYENLPLGFISTPEAADERADATHAGSSLFLSKPLDNAIVQKVIGQLIAMREGGRFRVLVVDDDQDLASLTSRCLGQFGMITRIVNDPLLVNSALQEFSPDLILLDVNMPGMSGFEVCRGLRSSARWRDVPILFLTAQTDLNSRLTAYEAGADDYLPKPVINVELLTRVKVRLERARELKERSEKDLLTGLLLRRAFVDQLTSLISECSRYNFSFSLCLLDVDHFKKVNDSYGHHAGDEVLSTLGLLLRKRFRVEDLRGRWGGEEFILAFKHEKKELMQLALQRIMDELAQLPFKGERGEVFHVTFSAGFAAYPNEADNLQDLVKVADRRLYLAKERGRKQIVIDDD